MAILKFIRNLGFGCCIGGFVFMIYDFMQLGGHDINKGLIVNALGLIAYSLADMQIKKREKEGLK